MVSNGGLYSMVMEKLKSEPSIDETNITVAIANDGIVLLGGKVKSYTEKRVAEEVVEKIPKVKGIANDITVDVTLEYMRTDAELVKAALNALAWNFVVPHQQIKVAISNGHLVLSGEVEYYYQKVRATEAVEDLAGITFITNNITIKPSVMPLDVKNKIIKEFERNARLDAEKIKVEVDGGMVILKGQVRSLEEEREARVAASSVPGVSSVVDQLVVSW
jgi:osmotically-inducible protein OsmY